ncbi:hypothetical protein QAD02_014324, partial [Eretmocerus hayati]
ISLVLLFALVVVSTAKISQFDISEYVYGIDYDLQARARAAIEAERFTASNKNRSDKADSSEEPCRVRPERPCPPSKYRTPSGACNNVRFPGWGARGSPYLRILPPAYEDGVSEPRSRSIEGGVLPSEPQLIDQILTSGRWASPGHRHEGLSSLAGVWSELLLRDLSSPMRPHRKPEECCSRAQSHSECWSAGSDVASCLGYWRATPTLSTHSCSFEAREQMNGASGYLDGSDLYGANDDRLHKLRTYSGGRVDPDQCELCSRPESSLGRVYRVLLSEHNSIADRLAALNSHWNDAKLYLEARRAVVAQLQHVTLKEFAPSVLGETVHTDKELMLTSSGFYSGYSSTNRGGAIDAVALAALQALTSLTRIDKPELRDQLSLAANRVNLNVSGNPEDELYTSSAWQPSALLLHVARDHGLPGYAQFVNYCSGGSVQVNNFTSLGRMMKDQDAQLLRRIYARVEDVDLLIGGILEVPMGGAAVGPTFACLLREQLQKLRNSDRFWYENDIPPSSLSAEQISEVRKISLAGLLCANAGLAELQPMSLFQPDPYLNTRISCDQHARLQMGPWREHGSSEQLSNPESDNQMGSGVTWEHAEVGPIDEAKQPLFPTITEDMLAEAVRKAENELIKRKQLEYNSWLEQRYADPKSPAGIAASFSKANKGAIFQANSSHKLELISKNLIGQFDARFNGRTRRRRQAFDLGENNFPTVDFNELPNVDISGIVPPRRPTNHEEIDCPPEDGPCDLTTPYRTYSGHCNNLRNPNLGKSLTTFARLLPPVYEDGISSPKFTSVSGAPLPNPRLISSTIHPDISNLHNRYTLMVMQYAQFVDHDLTMTPIHKGFAESIPSCRSCDSASNVHPECNPFPVPPNDHYYPTVNISSGARLCIPSMRSLPGQQQLGPREQVNQNTGFLDGSVVYGENPCIADILKGLNGRMNMTERGNRAKGLLPQSATHPECRAPSGFCFIAGDGRASEQPGLTAMHTVWVREHNRVMEGLRQVNPQWDATKLFEETRRIISAMIQHITYNEFLPRILGWNAVSLYGLKLLSQDYFKEYSPTCNPSILNEFGAAAYRIGHSLLRPHLPRMDRNYQNIEPAILLRDGFFNPDMLYQPEMIDEMTRGLVSTPMETLDQFITGEVSNHLFEIKGIPHSGFDLIALNIQRGRDHGLPGYNQYRALCNLKRANSFEDLSREMAPEVIARLKKVYQSVDDIDLFPGGMSERPLQGGMVGPTFACIIAIQFRQTRKCDRFWYETDDPTIRFSEPQLAELRKTTLSKVLCNNMDVHSEMQRAAFDLPSNFLNPRVPCSSMPEMNFEAWRETSQGCQIGNMKVPLGAKGFPSPCISCVCTPEGTQCASLRITDCNQLLREASRDAILQDDVCTAQCGFVLAATANSPNSQFKARDFNNNFPPQRNTFRSGSFASASASASSSSSGFKLPDLSQFLG